MISGIVAVLVFAVVISVIVIYARDPGPTPVDIAVGYELAWDRLDFDALWSLSAVELRDGLDKPAFIAAKRAAYEGRSELGHLVAHVDVEEQDVTGFHAVVRTCVTLHDGSVVHNDVSLIRRASAWAVSGYQLVSGPSQAV